MLYLCLNWPNLNRRCERALRGSQLRGFLMTHTVSAVGGQGRIAAAARLRTGLARRDWVSVNAGADDVFICTKWALYVALDETHVSVLVVHSAAGVMWLQPGVCKCLWTGQICVGSRHRRQ